MARRQKSETAVDDLTEKQAKAEHARLEAEIAEHDRRYYQDDAPTRIRRRLRSRCASATTRSRRAFRELRTLESLTPACRRGAVGALRQSAPRSADAVARQRVQPKRTSPISSAASAAFCGCRTTRRSRSPPNRRSTACRCRCATRTASSSPARRAATAPKARTSPPMSRRSPTFRTGFKGSERSGRVRGARRSLHDQARVPRPQSQAGGGRQAALRQSAQHRRRLVAPEGRRRSRRRGRSASSPMPGAR